MNTNIPAKLINDKFMEKIATGDLNKAAEVATDFTRFNNYLSRTRQTARY